MINLPTKRESSSSDKKYSDEKSRHKQRNPVKVPYHSHKNSNTESDNKFGVTSEALLKYHV